MFRSEVGGQGREVREGKGGRGRGKNKQAENNYRKIYVKDLAAKIEGADGIEFNAGDRGPFYD